MRRALAVVAALAALAAGSCATVPPRSAVAPVSDAELRATIAVLSDDRFEGRMSGTVGEQRTIAYLTEELTRRGAVGGMPDGSFTMRFAIAAQKRTVPPEGGGLPAGQAEFTRAINAAGVTASHNVIGRVLGRRPDGRAVLLMAHWDHLGLCRPAGAPDRICNGAVDNASGTAAVLALVERVRALKLDRDVWFVFTGAEEWGLLGAKAFAAAPPLPLASIVAGFNLDTIAVAPKGMPVAIVAPPNSPLEPLVRSATRALGRKWDGDGEAAAFIQRQDGWPLAQRGVPMAMAGGSFSDMARLRAFFTGAYHGPEDELTPASDLGGAVEDANLHLELVRRAASRSFRPGRR
ncbi:M20/M25/M40 family metallo-hydrolase [Sphingomonas mesophila]|uniref:M20/M25/M40 family metallo-hydrolase n=1 Tax=Sphingomonas mesophila TaxID=2303576 RepID=UPI000E596263|nr:M20/M25/M40 family metallo-hydrolase [Sphingomonas mesophila]